MSCLAQPVESIFNKSKRLRKILKNFSKHPSQTRESNKIDGVQFRLRMTENQHKRSELHELPFQQTEFNEPANLVSQPVQTVERGSQNLSDHSSKIHKSKKIKPSKKNNSEWLRTDTNSAKDPNYCFSELNSMNRLIWFINQFSWLR